MNDAPKSGHGALVRAVVLNYDQPQLTIRCAKSLLQQEGVRIDLVVVDNWSNERQLNELRGGLPPGVTLVENAENRGYAAGNNAGLREGAGSFEFALVMNNDAVMEDPFTIARLADALNGNRAYAACSPLVRDEASAVSPEEAIQVRRIPTFWELVIVSSGILRRLPGLRETYRRQVYADRRPFERNSVIPCESINGCCFLIRWSALEAIGYLDEGTFLYGEEMILGFQLRGLGLGCALVTQSVIDHIQGASAGRNAAGATVRGMLRRMRSEKYYARKYLGVGGLAVFAIAVIGAVDMACKVVSRPFRNAK
jgi:GT2 family glycosyltransferase